MLRRKQGQRYIRGLSGSLGKSRRRGRGGGRGGQRCRRLSREGPGVRATRRGLLQVGGLKPGSGISTAGAVRGLGEQREVCQINLAFMLTRFVRRSPLISPSLTNGVDQYLKSKLTSSQIGWFTILSKILNFGSTISNLTSSFSASARCSP